LGKGKRLSIFPKIAIRAEILKRFFVLEGAGAFMALKSAA
jgi:hypothetical protein